MRKLKKIVILDRIILLNEQWEMLRSMTDELIEYAGLDIKEILKKLDEEADKTEAPMCWTQLAQEEMTIKEINERVCGADGIITCWTNIPDEVIRTNPQLKYMGFWTNLADHRVNMERVPPREAYKYYLYP
jgi:hypothetical protein